MECAVKFPVSIFSLNMAQKVALADLKRLGVPEVAVLKIAGAASIKSSPVSVMATKEVRK